MHLPVHICEMRIRSRVYCIGCSLGHATRLALRDIRCVHAVPVVMAVPESHAAPETARAFFGCLSRHNFCLSRHQQSVVEFRLGAQAAPKDAGQIMAFRAHPPLFFSDALHILLCSLYIKWISGVHPFAFIFFLDWIRVASESVPGMSVLPPSFPRTSWRAGERRGLVE